MSAREPSPSPIGDQVSANGGNEASSGHAKTGDVEPGRQSATELSDNHGLSADHRRTGSRLSRINTSQNAKDKDGKPVTKAASNTSQANAGLDPLSTQIYLRTNSNTEPSIAQRLLNTAKSETSATENIQKQSQELSGNPSNGALDAVKEKRKGPSFLSRLNVRSAWKRDEDSPDSDSELGELRTEGTNAQASMFSIGAGGGYIPFHKEPPRYIRVRPHNKKTREFNRLFLAQELSACKPRAEVDKPQGRTPATAVGTKLLKSGDAIWAAEFSLDGRYLAVAGKDHILRVFAVISTPEERKNHETEEETESGAGGERLSAPVFQSKPVKEFDAHTGEILALTWSKNSFLLSSSMDKTVRLWHMSRNECLWEFKHNDLVTSIAFHPTDDRFFLAGSLDAQLRLWSIPDKSVAFSTGTAEFVTAVGFAPDGKTAICGLLSGICLFFETKGLKQQFQIHVRSSRGKNAKGSKITGIRTISIPSKAGGDAEVKVLISSNDSRIRIYDLKTRMLELKLKGLENQSSQIHALFSDDARYVICGSENRKAYVWNLEQPELENKDKQPYECFDAHPEIVTNALMAPVATKQLLSASGDPIYDLCNPPPVMLLSLEENNASQSALSESAHGDKTPPNVKKPEESPAYIARTKHRDGNIIVTTDRTGTIKVFRQDCAHSKRQQSLWETGSKFSGKLPGVGRSASIITKTSGGSRVQSRRGSLNLGPNHSQPPSDRIMSWRQDIESGRASIGGGTPTRSERSVSPMKGNRAALGSAANLASEARKQPYAASPTTRSSYPASPASSTHAKRSSARFPKEAERDPTVPPTPSFSLISASDSDSTQDKAEGGFWNLSRWKGISGLRYSTSSNAVANSPLGSGETLRAPEQGQSSGRRSLAVGDLRRLKIEDAATSRRTPRQESPPKPTKVEAKGVKGHEDDDSTVDRERTDSGVAELSDGSSMEAGKPKEQLQIRKRRTQA